VKNGNENKIAVRDCFIKVVCVCGYFLKQSQSCKKNNNLKNYFYEKNSSPPLAIAGGNKLRHAKNSRV
jgi:hypothetical protein